jgi:tRNA(fMet)-specific endonuclease VapC
MKQALLDTNIVSEFMRSNPNVMKRVDEHVAEYGYVSISIITYFEVSSGLFFRDAKKQLSKFLTFVELNRVVPMSLISARLAAETVADLRKRGTPIEATDTLIAGIALENDFVVATNNTAHFDRIKNLEVENWTK